MTDSYNLTSLDLPKLNGRALRLFTSALDNGALRGALSGQLLKQGGVLALRERVYSDTPTFYPMALDEAADLRDLPPVDVTALEEQIAGRPNNAPFASIADYARAYRDGRANPEAVAEAVLAAIADADDDPRPLRAFRATNRADLMTQARASAERLRAGRPISLLDGVPVAVKDEVDQVPYGTTVGTSFMGQEPATEDATVVARLRAAGALLIGKTNMHEIGINPDGFNQHYGIIRNPYSLDCHAGGSSNGSAAAVAAGFCPVAIGADGGGSIRIPGGTDRHGGAEGDIWPRQRIRGFTAHLDDGPPRPHWGDGWRRGPDLRLHRRAGRARSHVPPSAAGQHGGLG